MRYFRWISKKINRRKRVRSRSLNKNYIKYKEGARTLVLERLDFFNKHYKFKIGIVSIRNQKRRWGSCSSLGNLNFNYKIFLLPSNLSDYIIVHELCHLGEFNHSEKFWDLVSETIPNFNEIEINLRKFRL